MDNWKVATRLTDPSAESVQTALQSCLGELAASHGLGFILKNVTITPIGDRQVLVAIIGYR